MTFHNFTDGDVLYGAQLNALAADLAADATQKANVALNAAATDATAKDDVLKAQLEAYADDQDDIVRADAAADATAKDAALVTRLDALERDTGWRQLSALLAEYTSGDIFLRRIGKFVTVTFVRVITSRSGQVDIPTALAGGFSPPHNVDVLFTQGGTPRAARIFSHGTIRLLALTASQFMSFTVTYPTDQAWPTHLPGTPA